MKSLLGESQMNELVVLTQGDVLAEVQGQVGLITLNRAKALNALSLDMVRSITKVLSAWQHDPRVQAVAMRGMGKESAFGAFCAGGDIRFFYQAALAGDPRLEDFFTEEYRLNHLIHHYPKPCIVFMDGIVMGGGMGLAQGAKLRIATERTKMAMPETMIGLFPDVGGGYFLSRCQGALGEYLGLTGQMLNGAEAVFAGLADVLCESSQLNALWTQLPAVDWTQPVEALKNFTSPFAQATQTAQAATPVWWSSDVNHAFEAADVQGIAKLLQATGHTQALEALHKRSPLMLAVTLEQIRRARHMNLSDELRMERDMVRHSFHPQHLNRTPSQSDTVEGIRALAVDKDHAPRWSPAHIEEVTPEMVTPFFTSPWPAAAHPLRDLQAPAT
jgi:enoyl-CoA hydratase/carnithine racemase